MTKPEQIPNFPALRSLGDLADAKATALVDSREQTPLIFTRLASVVGTLTTADYSYVGAETTFSIERKSIQDLAACCTGSERDRLERELIRLRGYTFKRLVIVGHPSEVLTQRYRGRVTPKAIMHTLAAFEIRYDTPVVWCSTPEAAAMQVEEWIYWHSRETIKAANSLLTATKAVEPQEAQV